MGWNPPSLSQTEIWILLTFTHISIHICYTYFRSWEHGALNVSGSTVWCYYRWRIRRCQTVNMMEIWNLHLFWLGKKKLININTNLLHSQGRRVSVKSRGLAPCRKWSWGKTTTAKRPEISLFWLIMRCNLYWKHHSSRNMETFFNCSVSINYCWSGSQDCESYQEKILIFGDS